MARLIVLGTASAVSNAEHDNTHFLLLGDQGSRILIDCGSNPITKLAQYGLSREDLDGMILTHFHPDHVGGVPLFLMQLWLTGRKTSLPIYGLHHCLHRVEVMMNNYQWETWPHFFPIYFQRVAEDDNVLLLENDDFRITAWPTRHFIPTIGLRIEVKTTGGVIGYSCDTEPIDSVTRLAQNVDLLIHEAAGKRIGHSSPTQAGQTATQAGAKRLALIHYDVRANVADLIDEARTSFDGPVEVAQDYSEYTI
jgi:ribonuclease Z